MGKKGLSPVITTLIMILIVLVAIGIVWVIVRNVIRTNSEQVSLDKFTIDLSIENVKIMEGNLSITVKRKVGAGNLSGIKFIITDRVGTELIEKNTTLKELEEEEFVVFPGEVGGLNFFEVIKVSIAPIFSTDVGETLEGNIVDSYNVGKNEEKTEEDGGVSNDTVGLILWNKLGSDAEVTNSEIGIDGAWDGSSTYEPCKFDDGSYSNSVNNRIKFASFDSALVNDWTKFTIEFWLETPYSVTNGCPSDNTIHSFFVWYSDVNNRWRWEIGCGDGLDLSIKSGGTWRQYRDFVGTWTANESHHLAFVMDTDGIDGGSNKARMYLDGEQIYSSDTAPLTLDSTATLYGLVSSYEGTFYTPLDGVMDNLKIYDYAKTDFSDRFTEQI